MISRASRSVEVPGLPRKVPRGTSCSFRLSLAAFITSSQGAGQRREVELPSSWSWSSGKNWRWGRASALLGTALAFPLLFDLRFVASQSLHAICVRMIPRSLYERSISSSSFVTSTSSPLFFDQTRRLCVQSKNSVKSVERIKHSWEVQSAPLSFAQVEAEPRNTEDILGPYDVCSRL